MNKICVKGQSLYFYRPPEPIPKSQVNFSKIEFDMDETWSGFLSVVAQFIQNGKPKNVKVEDGYCFVPSELGIGAFELCLRGDDGESVVASVNRLTLEVCEGFDPSGETPLPPSPDLYTQLVKEIDSGKKIAQSVREDADSGKFNGPPGKSPKIIDGNWFVWDFEAGAYVDTGVAASGGGGGGAVSSVNGQTGEVKLTAKDVGAISQDDLQEATNEALAQAKASGEFDGADGRDGVDGKDGYTPVKGVDYFDGKDGINGKDGVDGKNGADGRTPIKGTDYFTDADKAEMVSDVIAALPKYNGEVVAV